MYSVYKVIHKRGVIMRANAALYGERGSRSGCFVVRTNFLYLSFFGAIGWNLRYRASNLHPISGFNFFLTNLLQYTRLNTFFLL